MHRILFSICLWFVLANRSYAADADSLITNGDIRKLGDVWSRPGSMDDQLHFNIELTNKANKPMDVINMATSCSCITTGIKALKILAGETKSIPVVVNLVGREGLLRGAVVIELKDHSVKQIVYEANVNVPLRCVPQVITISGKKAKKTSFKLVIYEARSKRQKEADTTSLRISSMVQGLDIAFTITSHESSSLPSTVNGFFYEKYTIEGDVIPKEIGSSAGFINIADSSGESLFVSVPLKMEVTQDTYLVRDGILIGDVRLHEPKACRIEVVSSTHDKIRQILIDKTEVAFNELDENDNTCTSAAQFLAQWNTQAGLSILHGEAVMKSGTKLPFSLVAFTK